MLMNLKGTLVGVYLFVFDIASNRAMKFHLC